jgi:uncharacterized protein with PIN domain
MKLVKVHIPLLTVKAVCIVAVLAGVFSFAAGHWASAVCCLLGAYILERNRYRCPSCNLKLDMKHPVFKSSVCPACKTPLRRVA